MFLFQLPADFSKLHPSDSCHSHMTSSQSRSSIASDSGSSSLSDIYQVIKDSVSIPLESNLLTHSTTEAHPDRFIVNIWDTHSHAFKSCSVEYPPPSSSLVHLSPLHNLFMSVIKHTHLLIHRSALHMRTQTFTACANTVTSKCQHISTCTHMHKQIIFMRFVLFIWKCRSQRAESWKTTNQMFVNIAS